MTTAYLAGGITGLSYEECTGWRNQANKVLTKAGFTVLDPMRGKEHLKNEQDIKGSYQNDPSCNSASIFQRDIKDVDASDVLLVNLIGLKGIGTPFEMGYAYAKGKILVIVAPEKYMEHPFSKEPSAFITDDLDNALYFMQSIERNSTWHHLGSLARERVA